MTQLTDKRYLLVSDTGRFYRHITFGGLVTDPIDADTTKENFLWLDFAMRTAKKDFLGEHWSFAELNYFVNPLNQNEIKEKINEAIKKRALDKLSNEEKKILGLV
jgi:hypothetical protein